MEYQQSPSFFVRGPSAFTRLIGFATLSLLLIASDARFDYLSKVRASAVSLLYPFQWIANRPAILYNDISDLLISNEQLQKEIKRLNLQALVQGEALQKLKTLELENTHLRDLLEAQTISARPTKMAEIVHLGLDSYSHKVIVNAGRDKQIKAGQAVVDVDGVLGQVTKLYEHTSEVTLLIDQDLSIPVQVERNGLRAIAFGSGRENSIHLPYLPANVDIKVGDRLVTSGIDGVYPAGLGVAVVEKVNASHGSPFATIVAAPIAEVHNFRQVLLLDLDAQTAVNDEVSKVLENEKQNKALKSKKIVHSEKHKNAAI
jgi:rod shape-determining protein MreC